MNRPRFWSLSLALALLASAPANAQLDLGVVASTEGLGVEVAPHLSPSLLLRLGAAGWTYSDDLTAGEIEYDAEAEFRSASAILDWSPGGGAFHLSVGAVFNDHVIDGDADFLALAVDEFEPEEIAAVLALLPPGADPGRLRAEASFDPVSVYAGLGWRTTKPKGLGLAFDLGAILLGTADATVSLETDLPLQLIPDSERLIDDFLREQESEIEEEAEDYQVFPVVRFSLFVRL